VVGEDKCLDCLDDDHAILALARRGGQPVCNFLMSGVFGASLYLLCIYAVTVNFKHSVLDTVDFEAFCMNVIGVLVGV
jgi:hypothetical protein